MSPKKYSIFFHQILHRQNLLPPINLIAFSPIKSEILLLLADAKEMLKGRNSG
jgi:hypothetical protein